MGRVMMTGTDTLFPKKLSDGQKDCLRLVMLHFSSKEIARKLGISPHTVDKRLKQAILLMGVGSRVEAARILAESEDTVFTSNILEIPACAHLHRSTTSKRAEMRYQSLVYQRPDLSPNPIPGNYQSSPGEWNPAAGKAGNVLQEEQAVFNSRPDWQYKTGLMGLVSGNGFQTNSLKMPGRLLAMSAMVAGSILVFAVFVSVIEGLSRLY
jgi:DNA-binding CsgD family transcriptional regulator